MARAQIPAYGSEPMVQDDIFHFHPRATNPELWRTSVPLVVRERCARHKGLVATWLAIHWLIVLHAASGRAHFGLREIAAEAGVGRNELAGAAGHIQRLVGLGLLRIVGYKAFRGLREPRPIYHIDLAELERLSLDLVPDVLRDHHIDRPPPAAPDPRQLQLFALPDQPAPGPAAHPSGTARAPGGASQPGGAPESRTDRAPAMGAFAAPWPENGTDQAATAPAWPESGTVGQVALPAPVQAWPENGTEAHVLVPPSPDSRQAAHQSGTEGARNRDIERAKERANEGASETLTPNLLQSLVTQATQAVLAALRIQGHQPAQPAAPVALTSTPTAPAGAEPLPASVLALWQGDEPGVSRRELHQLALIAAEVDGPSGGHGAYWLGRAILMADLCLTDRGQARSLAYLRRVLRRWREEGSWGSDREAAEAPYRASAEAPARGRPAPEPPAHPAVRAYVEALHEAPNAVQAAQIAATVKDMEAWRRVLADWQLNGWAERSVGKMLDRYQKQLAAVADSGPPPSVGIVHTYPGLTPEQRDRWIRRFHAAISPAEKRAVLARLEQEHPQ